MKTAVEKLFNIWLEKEYISPNEWSEALEMEKEQMKNGCDEIFERAKEIDNEMITKQQEQ
jgi:hypothetical protein